MSLFVEGKTYEIEGKLFKYMGKIEKEKHKFVCMTDRTDVRRISIFLKDYLYTIYRGTA